MIIKFHGMKESTNLNCGDLFKYIPVQGGMYLGIFLKSEEIEYRGKYLTILDFSGEIKKISPNIIWKLEVLREMNFSHE